MLAPPGRVERGRRAGPTAPLLLNKLRSKNQLDWSRAMIDSSHVRAARRAQKRTQPGRPRTPGQQAPPHRRRPGIPLAVSLNGGNRNGVTQLLPLLDKIPAAAGAVGRPHRRPDVFFADRGYDHDTYRRCFGSAASGP